VADDLSAWFSPAFGNALTLAPDLNDIEALAEDRAALWRRVGSASFLDDDEKRAMLGIALRG
jgi:phage portal protein BeeE